MLSSYCSFLQREGFHDTSSQTKKTAPSSCSLKRKGFHFLCVRRQRNKLWHETIHFLSFLSQDWSFQILWRHKTKCNFFWINLDCVKLHHGTRVLLLCLTSFTENVKKDTKAQCFQLHSQQEKLSTLTGQNDSDDPLLSFNKVVGWKLKRFNRL